ncbi:MAG: hypothetical protein ACLP0B_19485 [Steroidobacteraceae bacterium]
MSSVRLIYQGRSVLGGHAIELDYELDDGTRTTLQVPFPQIQFLLRQIWAAAAAAETTQRQAAGEQMRAIVAPYRGQDVRTGKSQDGTIGLEFRTAQGPVQIAMDADLTRKTIEQLSAALIATVPVLRPS